MGGTYDGFIGEWVDVKGKYIEDGARQPTPTVPPPLPFPFPRGCGRSLTPAIPAGYVEEGGGFNWVNLLYIPVIGGLGVGIVLTLQAIN